MPSTAHDSHSFVAISFIAIPRFQPISFISSHVHLSLVFCTPTHSHTQQWLPDFLTAETPGFHVIARRLDTQKGDLPAPMGVATRQGTAILEEGPMLTLEVASNLRLEMFPAVPKH